MDNHKLPTEVVIRLTYDGNADSGIRVERVRERNGSWVDADGAMVCSVCKRAFDSELFYAVGDYPSYCPDCGARMDSPMRQKCIEENTNEIIDKSCSNCKHGNKEWWEEPCDSCTGTDYHWEPNYKKEADFNALLL